MILWRLYRPVFWRALLKVISSVRFLARQGLAFRGHQDINSNFIQLLNVRADDDMQFKKWLCRRIEKPTSAEIQNEILKDMALLILRAVVSCIKESIFYSIMADESTDITNHEQLVICIRWVDKDLNPHEDFIDATTLTKVIKDITLRLGLDSSKLRGQCYDGCSTIKGLKKGVSTQINVVDGRTLCTHCYCHALNLACNDSIKDCRLIREALDTSYEITKLVKYPPKRESALKAIQENVDCEEDEGEDKVDC